MVVVLSAVNLGVAAGKDSVGVVVAVGGRRTVNRHAGTVAVFVGIEVGSRLGALA